MNKGIIQTKLDEIIKRQQKWKEAFFSSPQGNYKQYSPTEEEKAFLEVYGYDPDKKKKKNPYYKG